jgi:tripartite-type tricarboxylate transporter receptor subunit TctC
MAAALALAALSGARAQSYPQHAIRMIVPYPPAGANDLLARIVGERLTAAWGQPVVVDNRPGANGLIGVEAAKNSAPDGYTLVMGAAGTHAINPALYHKLPYDAVKDFTPVTMLASAPIVVLVHPDVPARSIKELVALSRASPGKLNYGVGASLFNLTMELFKSQTGADITYVPYRGSVPALTALTAGEVTVGADVIQTPLPFMKDGKLRALAVTTRSRAFAAPEVPTMIESGVADFDLGAWSGIYAPAGTPAAIVARIDSAIRKILDEPDVLAKLHQVGYEPTPLGPAEFAALMRRETAQYAKIVAAAHIPMLD